MSKLIGFTTLMNAEAVAKNDTHYTSPIKHDRMTGTSGVFIVSTAGSITVTQECSIDYDDRNPDAANWYAPVDTSGTTLGSVAAAVTVTTGRWVSYTTILAPHIRFKVVEGNSAATSVTLKLVHQEEN